MWAQCSKGPEGKGVVFREQGTMGAPTPEKEPSEREVAGEPRGHLVRRKE